MQIEYDVKYRLDFVDSTLFGCCDFISQSILVRTANNTLSVYFKDTPLLDRVGSQYPRRDHSFNLGVCILRSVHLP